MDPFARSWAELPTDLEQKILDVTGPIQQIASSLRKKPLVNWLPYLEAGLISQKDYAFITSFQATKTKEERDELLEYFKDGAFDTLVKVVQRICVVEEIQKFLVLIDDMLWEDISRVEHFNPKETEPWNGFMELLSCTDDFVRNIAGRIISKFISQGYQPKSKDLMFFLSWVKEQLRPENMYLLSVARCLQRLVRVDEYRLVFMNMNVIFRIIRILSIGVKPQAQYQLVFSIWVASFNPLVAEKINRYGITPVLMELLQSAPAEIVKLPRVIISTFRNMLEKPREEGVRKHNALVMIQCKLGKCLHIMNTRRKSIIDPEYKEDLEVVDSILQKYIVELSTFDEYQLEVRSGLLEWSVVHNSKSFWKENADRLNDNKYELLKTLVALLDTSTDRTVLCIAAHDLGEYMSYYPRGKKVVEALGGKDSLLKLLSHQNPVVKYHALKSLQILMLNNYEVLIDYIGENKAATLETARVV